MVGPVPLFESASLSLILSATFWNAVSVHAPVDERVVTALVLATAAVLTAAFLLDRTRDRARIRRARNG
ncbi:MAG: hypothetical protein ABEH47_06770 [Haloferacaceae archaeon]